MKGGGKRENDKGETARTPRDPGARIFGGTGEGRRPRHRIRRSAKFRMEGRFFSAVQKKGPGLIARGRPRSLAQELRKMC